MKADLRLTLAGNKHEGNEAQGIHFEVTGVVLGSLREGTEYGATTTLLHSISVRLIKTDDGSWRPSGTRS